MTSDQERFEAFVAFLEGNKSGMVDAGVSKDYAMRAIACLADKGMSAERLVLRARHPHFGDELLQLVSEKFQGKRRAEFINALFALPYSSWEKYFDGGIVAEFSATPEEFEFMLEHHKDVLFNSEHPMFDRVNPDSYWQNLVRRFIARRDYQRAYDELKKAIRGLLVYREVNDDGPRANEMNEYAYQISQEALIGLVREMHDAMTSQKLIEAVPEGNYQVANWYVRLTSYDTKMTTHHRPRVSESTAEVAGFEIATRKFLVTKGERRPCYYAHESPCEKPYVFTSEGGMVLRIAEWCRQKRNEKRRKKHDKIVADYKKLKGKK